MREKTKKQMPLMITTASNDQVRELEAIDRLLESEPTIVDLVFQDLRPRRPTLFKGANGMSAEQVLRCAIVKQMFGFTYKELEFHLCDSVSLRQFCMMGILDKTFKRSALAKNIKRISAQTWEEINRIIVARAAEEKIDKGREIRIDATVVESNIHHPSDSTLLYDCVRVLARLLNQARAHMSRMHYTDHSRRAKRRMVAVQYAKRNKQRREAYKDLVKVSEKTVGYAEAAIDGLKNSSDVIAAMVLSGQLTEYTDLARRVIDQTRRRVFNGESVPADEKIVSIFEPHTDIIVKDNRDTYYGHKVYLSAGTSNLITDCVVVEGNPADTQLTTTMLERQKEIYGRVPLKVALDGGFASRENLRQAKELGIKDVCFAKKRGLQVEDMCRSEWVYNRLRRFRAGVESVISWIKRAFGMNRCTWKGDSAFKSYVWLSVVTANLLTMVRHNTT